MAAFVVNTTLIYKSLYGLLVHIITILLWLMLDIGPNFKFREKTLLTLDTGTNDKEAKQADSKSAASF